MQNRRSSWVEGLSQRELILITIPFMLQHSVCISRSAVGSWPFGISRDGLLGSQWSDSMFKHLFSEASFDLYSETPSRWASSIWYWVCFAIGFALLLDEVRLQALRICSTVSYLPHFVLDYCCVVRDMLSIEHGIINQILVGIGILINRWISFQNRIFSWMSASPMFGRRPDGTVYLAAIPPSIRRCMKLPLLTEPGDLEKCGMLHYRNQTHHIHFA